MRYGARPPAEFVEGVPRKQRDRQPGRITRWQDTPAKPPGHIDLRIIRPAAVEGAVHELEWHRFLANAGTDNHELGMARSLGSVAVTYVPSHLMNEMLSTKSPSEYANPKRKRALFSKVAAGINEFIRSSSKQAFEFAYEKAAYDFEMRGESMQSHFKPYDDTGDLDEIFAEIQRSHDEAMGLITVQDEVIDDLEPNLQILHHTYGPATLAIKGVQLYGRHYGVDLSLNEQLFDERQGFIGHLRSEGLDTSILARDWDAHGTFFDLMEHVGEPTLTYRRSRMPMRMSFEAPKVEHQQF